MQSAPSAESALQLLPKKRLVDLGRDIQLALSASASKDRQVHALLTSGRLPFRTLLQRLGRDELKLLCKAHGLDDRGRARQQLAARLLAARGAAESSPPAALFSANEAARDRPRQGDILRARHRQWLVEAVHPATEAGELTRVQLVCLDDDNQGRSLELLWELELGAKVHRPEAHGLGDAPTHIDPPRHFAAYLHALKWNTVTASDGRLFQAPFRAGIEVFHHQLTPLKKALSLPRANLFIADDVGLGKTIEAGLVLSELWLRQRVNFALVVCPASVCLQWRDELAQRFGLQFAVMSRNYVADRRRERGFGCNPWSTHHRFIISHQLLRRPEYRDPLLAHLAATGNDLRRPKSLLILDEAHIAAPASHSRYAVDSQITKVVRDVAPRFENRLFLSATPHNGHSNSFSALLELLDPQRFTRGVPVQGKRDLSPIMVRRLKSDLRDVGMEHRFPERRVIQFTLRYEEGQLLLQPQQWNGQTQQYEPSGDIVDLGPAEPFELSLAEDLRRYTELSAPKGTRGRLVFINLQKRLLSSVEAFARTLQVHARVLQNAVQETALDRAAHDRASVAPLRSSNDYEAADAVDGLSDDAQEAADAATTAAQTLALAQPEESAREVLSRLLKTADRHRNVPDAKLRALLHWMQENQCAGVQLRRDSLRPGASKHPVRQSVPTWSDRRLIIFTEYGDTKRYLLQALTAAVADTDQGDLRILQFHGGMGDEQRQEVQRAFCSKPGKPGDPSEHPVRILIATDAAREGLNLQAHCADLIHWDVPWNPARMEQRNGRIDRTLQPSPEVRCHYFTYAGRSEDPVLARLVEKTETIKRELGSLGAVVLERIHEQLEQQGLTPSTDTQLQQLVDQVQHAPQPTEQGLPTPGHDTTQRELESARDDHKALRKDLDDAGRIWEASKRSLEFDPALLRDALNVGFELAGAGELGRTDAKADEDVFTLPELPPSWTETVDSLRPPIGRDEAPWEWRKRPARPVVFAPPRELSSDVVQLHLQHPLVQRVLGRFLAQGFSMNDLSRVTIVRTKSDALIRVIAFGRLSLFGRGAARLHDQLLSVAAQWTDAGKDGDDRPLKPFAEEADRKALERLEQTLAESPTLKGIPKGIQKRVLAAAPTLFAQLWSPIRDEADAVATDITQKLKARGRSEADALRDILTRQRDALATAIADAGQQTLDFGTGSDAELQRRQREADRKHMQARLQGLAQELEQEPAAIEDLYEVVLHRLEPIGLCVLWPQGRM